MEDHAQGERSLRRAERSRDEAEARLRSFQDGIPNPAWTVRLDGSIDYCNQRWLDYTGRNADQMVDWNWTEVLHPDDRARFHQRWRQAMETGEHFEEAIRIRRYDGVYRWHLLRDWPERDQSGSITRWFGTATDIDDLRRLSDDLNERSNHLQEVNHSLEQFAALVSHDLRAPLRTIAGYLELVEKRAGDSLDAQARRYLATARHGAFRMREMIEGLLAYARAGRIVPADEQPLPVRQAVDEALDNLADEIAAQGAQIRIPSDLPVLSCARLALVQVFQNLIGNAIRYRHPQRRPEIGIEVIHQGEGTCCLAVRDNGSGIRPELRQTVFEPFTRGQHEDISGSGIGLALVKRIVEERGGRVWMESELGLGTTFFFTLPQPDQQRITDEESFARDAGTAA